MTSFSQGHQHIQMKLAIYCSVEVKAEKSNYDIYSTRCFILPYRLFRVQKLRGTSFAFTEYKTCRTSSHMLTYATWLSRRFLEANTRKRKVRRKRSRFQSLSLNAFTAVLPFPTPSSASEPKRRIQEAKTRIDRGYKMAQSGKSQTGDDRTGRVAAVPLRQENGAAAWKIRDALW